MLCSEEEVDMAHNLGFQVIIEGVEDLNQLKEILGNVQKGSNA